MRIILATITIAAILGLAIGNIANFTGNTLLGWAGLAVGCLLVGILFVALHKPRRHAKWMTHLLLLCTLLTVTQAQIPVGASSIDQCQATIDEVSAQWNDYNANLVPKEAIHDAIAQIYAACDGWQRFGHDTDGLPVIPIQAPSNALQAILGIPHQTTFMTNTILGQDYAGTCGDGQQYCSRYLWYGSCSPLEGHQWDFTTEFPIAS